MKVLAWYSAVVLGLLQLHYISVAFGVTEDTYSGGVALCCVLLYTPPCIVIYKYLIDNQKKGDCKEEG